MGDDYHDVIGERIESLLAWMRQSPEPFDARANVDTEPGSASTPTCRHRLDQARTPASSIPTSARGCFSPAINHARPAAGRVMRRSTAISAAPAPSASRRVRARTDCRSRRAGLHALHLVLTIELRGELPAGRTATGSGPARAAVTSVRGGLPRGTRRRRYLPIRRGSRVSRRGIASICCDAQLAQLTDRRDELTWRSRGSPDETDEGAGLRRNVAVARWRTQPLKGCATCARTTQTMKAGRRRRYWRRAAPNPAMPVSAAPMPKRPPDAADFGPSAPDPQERARRGRSRRTLRSVRSRHADGFWRRAAPGGRHVRRRAAGRCRGSPSGHPFVGPAGNLLDRALAEAGIDRDAVYRPK